MNEELFQNLFHLSSDAIIAVDQTQRILFFNPSAEELFGYKAEELLGQSLDVLLPPESIDAHHAHFRQFEGGSEVSRWTQ